MAHNLLTDRLPDSISVCGRRYPVYTDYRRWILVIELFAEDLVDVGVKAECAAKLIFPGENPLKQIRDRRDVTVEKTVEVYRELVCGITGFASCGRTYGCGENSGGGRQEPVFDFTDDDERIYAAFRQVYGLDLCDPAVKLHFWTFMALLRNLPRETEFMQVVNLRMTDTARIEDDDLRRRVRRARANVRIRKDREDREKERNYG